MDLNIIIRVVVIINFTMEPSELKVDYYLINLSINSINFIMSFFVDPKKDFELTFLLIVKFFVC